MAKLIRDNTYSHSTRVPFSWGRLVLIGLGIGILYVALTYILHIYVLEPIYCGKLLDAQACQSSLENAGNIANILLLLVGTLLLALIRVRYAVLVSLASAITLWGLAGWTRGLPVLLLVAFSSLLFASSYLAYAWICQNKKVLTVVGVLVGIVACIRIIIIP